jgi:hypothetical protein
MRRLAPRLALIAALHLTAAGTIALAAPTLAHAQSKVSTQKLIDDAKAKFDDQQYDESIQKLSAALLRPDASRAQKIEVYRWLAYNYIVLKQEDSARTAIYALHALDEDFELPKTESPKFREPFKKYKEQWIDDDKPGQTKEAKAVAPVVLKHLPPAEVPRDQSVAISGSFDDPEKRVAKISLFYRAGSAGKFVEKPMGISGGTYKANVPGSAVKPPLLEYYVQAFDEGGLAIATRGDAETPLRIAVAGDSGSIFGTWWFWTGTTAVVAGGIIAGFLLTTRRSNGGPNQQPGPTQSTVTITISE